MLTPKKEDGADSKSAEAQTAVAPPAPEEYEETSTAAEKKGSQEEDAAFLEFEHEVVSRLHAAWGELSEVQRSRLRNYVDKTLSEAYEAKCPQPLHVTVLYAFGLLDKDFLFKSDPYIRVKLFRQGDEETPVAEFKTKTVNNTTSPAWNETFVFHPGATVGATLQFQVWDDDHRFKDDYLGQLNVRISPNAFASGFGPYQMLLEGDKAQGSLVFSYFLEPFDLGVQHAKTFEELLHCAQDALARLHSVDEGTAADIQEKLFGYMKALGEEVLAQRVVVRKEIRTMTEDECERFYNAICKMMENNEKNEPETSEFFRLASYHGWPGNYCVHRQESFPTWHRAYMVRLPSRDKPALFVNK